MRSLQLSLDSVTTNLHRMLRRSFIRQATFIAKIITILISLGVLAWVLVGFIELKIQSSQKLADLRLAMEGGPGGAAGPVQDDSSTDLGTLRSNAPLGQLGDIARPTAAPQAAPAEAPIPLGLIGTFTGGGAQPYAIIEEEKKKDQEVFVIGESVFGAGKLKRVYSDRVEIDRNGRIEVLKIDDSTPSGASTETPTGGSEVSVDQKELDDALANLPLLLTQARAVPYFKDGKAVGLRMFAIRTGSLFEKIGLQNGDILKSVNGNSLGDMTQAIKLFERLKAEKSLALVLERRGQETSINYSIR